MKAIVQDRYGSPDDLRLADVETPTVADDEVLVRVRSASVNALDWHVTRGMPYIVRLSEGRRRPRDPVRGVDLAGRVEAIGKNVTRFQPGDEVLGGGSGAFAEYAASTEHRLAPKPPRLAFDAAAALHVAGLTALQGLRDKARVQPGQRVLVNGAGGGVGTFAVALAKWLGAHVTAVTRTESVAAVRSLGADDVVDYRVEDFASRGERYDVVFDVGGNRSIGDCRRVLHRNGALVIVGGPAGRWLAPATRLLTATALSPFVSQRLVSFISKDDAADLALLAELAEAGAASPVLHQRYPLEATPDAIRYVGEGRATGKVVISVA